MPRGWRCSNRSPAAVSGIEAGRSRGIGAVDSHRIAEGVGIGRICVAEICICDTTRRLDLRSVCHWLLNNLCFGVGRSAISGGKRQLPCGRTAALIGDGAHGSGAVTITVRISDVRPGCRRVIQDGRR